MYLLLRRYVENSPHKRLIVDALIIAGVLLVAFLVYWGNRAQSITTAQDKKTHDILCTQRAYSKAQIRATERYKYEVAHGLREPIKGLTPRDIEDGLRRQRQFVRASDDLGCGDQ